MRVELINVTKIIQGSMILDHVNLKFESGKIYGLRGKNGSGKTMLIRAMCGLIKPSSGEILIDGKKLGEDIDFPSSVGVMIENPSFLDNYTGFQNLQFLAMLKGGMQHEKIREVLKMVGLDPHDKRPYRKYSMGMKQKLGLANAFLGFPDLLLLDEPLNALDQAGIEHLKEILLQMRSENKLIVVSSHDKEELEFLSDIIYVIQDGKIKED